MSQTPYRGEDYPVPASLSRLQGPVLVAGVLGLLVAAAGYFFDRTHFFQSYLVAFVFWCSVALGCFGLSMLHHMTRGAWGLVIRRPLEAASRTIPLLALLFVPLLFGLGELYHWTHAEAVAHDPVLQAKTAYLNVPFFVARAAGYFVIWTFFMWRLDTLSKRQDESAETGLFRRMQAWAAPGFLLLALTLTFASFDWLMSIDPHWFSSIYGLWFFTGCGLSGLVFVIVIASYLSRREPMDDVLERRHFHDYGKLFLAFVMLWAYLSFSQFLLIWSADLPEEIPFYLARFQPGWLALSGVLLVAHFILPFLVLLSADLKKRAALLAKVAVFMLFMRWLDIYWNVTPTLAAQHEEGLHLISGLWIDAAALVGLGGIWGWSYLRQLQQRPLLPVGDPYLAEALGHE